EGFAFFRLDLIGHEGMGAARPSHDAPTAALGQRKYGTSTNLRPGTARYPAQLAAVTRRTHVFGFFARNIGEAGRVGLDPLGDRLRLGARSVAVLRRADLNMADVHTRSRDITRLVLFVISLQVGLGNFAHGLHGNVFVEHQVFHRHLIGQREPVFVFVVP